MEKCNNYSVRASFYNFDFGNGKIIKCRNFADVFENGFVDNPVDAYIVMMNPGSCKPEGKNKVTTISDVSKIPVPTSTIDMTKAILDDAQECLVKLMKEMGYKKVRILNLTGNRGSDSRESIENIKKIPEIYKKLSIFFNLADRANELNSLTEKNAPFIIAWGCSEQKDLKEIKKSAWEYLKKINADIVGFHSIAKSSGKHSFYYIMPKVNPADEEVKNELVSQLKEKKYIPYT